MGRPERKPADDVGAQAVVPLTRWSPTVRRSYPRFSVNCAITLHPEGSDAAIDGTAVNVSRGGALIRTARQLDETKRHLVGFLPDDEGVSFAEQTCPDCGHVFGARRLQRMSVWARILRQGRGGGGRDSWAAAVEFEALIDLNEDDPRA